MLRKLTIIFFSVLLYFNPVISDDFKIVYLDVDKVITQSIAGKSVLKKLANLNESNIKKFNEREIKLADEEKNIVKQKNILSKEEFEKKVKVLRVNIEKFKSDINNSRKDIDKKRIEVSSKILKVLNTILSEYSADNSISLIIQKKNIVMGMTELDITNQMIELVNTKIKTVKLN
jgi:outer membrane protein